MYNKMIIPILAASIILNCALGYNLHTKNNDLKNAENTSQHYYNELVKEKQYREMDKIAGLDMPEEMQTPNKKTAFRRSLPNIYIPPRSAEPYIPIQPIGSQTVYIEANQRNYPSRSSYNPVMEDAARALNNIDVNMTLDSILPKTPIIYVYPEY